jgi:hypothetical protein
MSMFDYKDPNAVTLEFEIVSWLVNDFKSGLIPDQRIWRIVNFMNFHHCLNTISGLQDGQD